MPEGKKWRGKSVYQVLDRLKMAAQSQQALFVVETMTRERVNKLNHEAKEILIGIADELKGLHPDEIRLGHSWKCLESPTDHCIYNDRKDPFMDHCLFCGEPSDRG